MAAIGQQLEGGQSHLEMLEPRLVNFHSNIIVIVNGKCGYFEPRLNFAEFRVKNASVMTLSVETHKLAFRNREGLELNSWTKQIPVRYFEIFLGKGALPLSYLFYIRQLCSPLKLSRS